MHNFYETWKRIAFTLKRSERWCRYMAKRSHDPLPVFKVGGIVRMNECDLEHWLKRQAQGCFNSSSDSSPHLQSIA